LKNIKVLDCTLRDGAQTNAGRFGDQAIKDIVSYLTEAKIDLIECGYLKDVDFEVGRTYYSCTEDMERYIPEDKQDSRYCVLLDVGKYDLNKLRNYDGRTIDLIRASFFEWNLDGVYDYCARIQDKGYALSIQPMDTYSYSEENLERLLELANKLNPEMMAIVDTYSHATSEDVVRIYNKVEPALNPKTALGFHTHNNMLNAFDLARTILNTCAESRELRLDSSLFGMGRGGGNLNTEIITEYLMSQGYRQFNMKPILDAIDNYMLDFKQRFDWGYSMPMLYCALYGVHVNTAAYLEQKPGVTSYDLREMFKTLDPFLKRRYDYDYLDKVYDEYMKNKNA